MSNIYIKDNYIKNVFLKILSSKCLSIAIVIYCVLTVLSDLIFIFLFTGLGSDAGYFLQIVRYVNDGSLLYYDINNSYGFIGIWLYALIFYLFPNITYNWVFLYQFVFILLSVIPLYKIFCNFNIPKRWNIAALAIYSALMVHFISDIKLEVFVPLFLLMSYYYWIQYCSNKKFKYMFVAIVWAAGAFFIKQYCAVIIVAYCISVIDLKHLSGSFYDLCKLVGLYVCCLLFAYLLFLIVYYIMGTDLTLTCKYLLRMFGFNIVSDSNVSFSGYGEKNLSNIILGSFRYISIFIPAFWAALAFFLFNYKKINFKGKYITLCLMIAVGVIPFYLQKFPHYIVYSLPFMFIFTIVILQKLLSDDNLNLRNFSFLLIVILLFIPLLRTNYSVLKRTFSGNNNSIREAEAVLTNKLTSIVPPKSKVYIVKDKEQWFLCNYSSVNAKSIGYTFCDQTDEILNLYENNSFLITNKRNIKMDNFTKIEEFEFENDTLIIYKKKVTKP